MGKYTNIIDFKQNTIFLQKLKNGKQPTLPIPGALKSVLETWADGV